MQHTDYTLSQIRTDELSPEALKMLKAVEAIGPVKTLERDEQQTNYNNALSTVYAATSNTPEAHFDIFSLFHLYSQTRVDAALIGAALDGLQHAREQIFGKSFAGESCQAVAAAFLKNPREFIVFTVKEREQMLLERLMSAANMRDPTGRMRVTEVAFGDGREQPLVGQNTLSPSLRDRLRKAATTMPQTPVLPLVLTRLSLS